MKSYRSLITQTDDGRYKIQEYHSGFVEYFDSWEEVVELLDAAGDWKITWEGSLQ